jgi:hypothetical protein
MLQLPTATTTPSRRASRHPDAKLIAAANAFEPMLHDYMAISAEWRRLARKTRRDTEKKFAEHSWDGPGGKDPKHKYFMKLGKENGYFAISQVQSKLHTRMTRLEKIIWQDPPTTIEGLRAHALVAIWEARSTANDKTALLWGVRHCKPLLRVPGITTPHCS